MVDLTGKHILVSGASSGIGKATALLCDSLGARLTLTSRNEAALADLSGMLKNKSKVIAADLSREEDIQKLVEQVEGIDGLAHCAGMVKPTPLKFVRKKHIDEMFGINYASAVLICSHLMTQKKIKEQASAVFISSVSVDHPYPGGAMYVSSKAALEAFSRSFALEGAAKKIRSNVVSPALVKTKIWTEATEGLSADDVARVENQYPLGLGEPEDVANMIAFLLSDAARWITGTVISLDGGLMLNHSKKTG